MAGKAAGGATLPDCAHQIGNGGAVGHLFGFMRISTRAGLPKQARCTAGTNSSVFSTISPWPPKASMPTREIRIGERRAGHAMRIGTFLIHPDGAIHLVVEDQNDWIDGMVESGRDFLPVIRKPPSPTKPITVRSGCTILAPIADGTA